jgi:hypothetical protein
MLSSTAPVSLCRVVTHKPQISQTCGNAINGRIGYQFAPGHEFQINVLEAASTNSIDLGGATVDAYNRACPGDDWTPLELDGISTSGIEPKKSNWACPIDEAPFHAYPIISANVFTFGGLKTDTDGRVLNTDGGTIPGLYAAGEIVGLYYGNYTGATSVLKGIVFGRRAGQHAANRRSGTK